ncbi:hypothetical protein [Streptomyces sp. NPDC058240]|uniref:hypothetical protein n=1 Tax=Streptomyces sp. NPDC058240 TaxID=3346396 RepID=UPI0036F04101
MSTRSTLLCSLSERNSSAKPSAVYVADSACYWIGAPTARWSATQELTSVSNAAADTGRAPSRTITSIREPFRALT